MIVSLYETTSGATGATARVFFPPVALNALDAAFFVADRNNHSPMIPAATSAAPRATTGAACRQMAGGNVGSRFTGRR